MSDAKHADDLTGLMKIWFTDEFLPEFYEKYGQGAEIAVVILRNDVTPSWTNPIERDTVALILSNVTDDRHYELVENVAGKLRFMLRTSRPSADARHRPDLLEAGDFPFEGAGIYMNRRGGASGLMEESDWWVFKRVVEKYNAMRANLTQPAVEACVTRDRSVLDNPDKFLRGLEIT
jgi:hypothetical protein